MSEEQIAQDAADLRRAQWMLENQLTCVEDLIKFWSIYGPYATEK